MLVRAPLLALLVYVTLDLCLAAMPGAFVFDAAGSVDSIQARGRESTEVVSLTPPAPETFIATAGPVHCGAGALTHGLTHVPRRDHPLPRAALARAAAGVSRSEDPH
jgi:hypothetical protein